MTGLETAIRVALIGIGATMVMDLWLIFLKRVGVPTQSFAFIGRWVGHLFRGQWTHAAIGKAQRIAGELVWGWMTHYAVGVLFAALLVVLKGVVWVMSPTPVPAIAMGMVTVLVPLLVMQPAMGAGIASSKTPTPLKNCLRSLANHTVFGLGLYLAAVPVALFMPAA